MPLYDRDYYSWRAWIDRKVKLLLKNTEGFLLKTTADTYYEPIKGEDDNYVTDAEKLKLANFPAAITATLTVVEWADNSQTVAVAGVTADSNILVSPPSTSTEFLAYGAAQIRAISQGAGTVTFTCTTTPTTELIANILILG